MKRTAILVLGAMSALYAMSDVIVTSDGEYMQVYNVQPAPKWIFYTETADTDADIKKIAVENVFGYKIGDGPMTPVGSSVPAAQTQQLAPATTDDKTPRKLTPVAAADNAELIGKYNNHPPVKYKGKTPKPNKNTQFFVSLWGIEDNSILSDENVEIGFEKAYEKTSKGLNLIKGYRIKVRNKTDNPIYIDLASTYKIMNGGYAVPYFTNSVYSEGGGTSRGGAVNLGAVAGAAGIGGAIGTLANGITVGGANTKSADISTAEQQILTIPPHSQITLPGDKISTGKEIYECYEPIYFSNDRWINLTEKTEIHDKEIQKVGDEPSVTAKTLNICHWMQTDFTPENSPKKIGRIITYSTSPAFSTYTSLPVNLYMRGAYGLNNNTFPPTPLFYNDKTYEDLPDLEHFIVGTGYIKK